ncbi:P1 family peptidase [Notoacmeibacter sp. MSK16QG-6]|uniref:P1 family peptidase n=1 Tax=Notoacmeibacter sp. MSK16QG-6 TaxID=2957982 RepID=UPI0020A06FB4|nr:P1 family peptidase [Notoacmeibacter sp. MSK16QG-6]MCP1199441.1 P1 family peptidase [Notoacmeibacter sp. MSK16QG-6]
MMKAGARNTIADVSSIRVGHATDEAAKSGVSVIWPVHPATAAVHVAGGAPGTRETDLLAPENTVERVHALALSGGSAFGLAAADGVMAALAEAGEGFAVGPHHIPIVPSAILFDLMAGGNDSRPDYRALGRQALRQASTDIRLGSLGAGTGAMTATVRGGIGSASSVLDGIGTIGALVAVNALGNPLIGSTRHFWAAPFEQRGELGYLGWPALMPEDAMTLRLKHRPVLPNTNTTIAVIATDAALTKAQCKRLAMAAHDGFTRALWPAHLPMDGDLVFALSTAEPGSTPVGIETMIDLCASAASTMARAIARGIYEAKPLPGDPKPAWRNL